MISIISLIYESGSYGSKWLKIVHMNGEKVVVRYEYPSQKSWVGGHHPLPPQYYQKLATMGLL